MKKILILTIFVLTVLPFSYSSILATSNILSCDNNIVVEQSDEKDLYSKFVVPVFNGDPSFLVLSSDGKDCTQSFIEENNGYYYKNDRDYIRSYLFINDLVIAKDLTNTRDISNRYNKEFYKQVTGYGVNGMTGASDSYHGEICYAVSGSATCNNRGYIISYTTPSVTATSGINGWYPVSVNTTVTNKGAYITVNYSFKARWSMSVNVFTTVFTTNTISGSFNFNPQY